MATVRGFFVLALAACALGCGAREGGDVSTDPATDPATTASANGRALVLGDVERDDPTRVLHGMTPLAEYLAARLGDHGIDRGLARVAPDPQSMGRWMADGAVDLYFDTGHPASIVREISGAKPLLRRWKDGAAEYHSVIFARSDSGLSSVADLGGKIMAFDDAASTSGFLLPMSLVLEAGLEPVPVQRAEDAVAAPGVACVFTGDDANVIEWVLAGRAAGGAIDNLTWDLVIPEETRSKLRVLDSSESHPRGYLMVGAGLEPELVAEIERLLLNLHESEEGRAILASMITTRFDPFPEDPAISLDRVVVLRRLVEPGPA